MGKKRILILLVTIYLLSTPLAFAQKTFPASLPLPSDNASLSENTPEYVIIKSSDQTTFSSETAASVANIFVTEGSRFKTGDILLELDCRLQKAELQKSLAQQSETSMAQKSAEKLKSYGAISDFELVKATTDALSANADVNKLSAIVEKCVIKAPFNGAVAELMVHAHETVKSGDPLLKIVSTEKLEFEIQIPSGWLEWLHIGSIFNVKLNDINKTISAKITKINPQIEPISQSVKIIGTITEHDPMLLPGMSGQAIFTDNPANNKIEKK